MKFSVPAGFSLAQVALAASTSGYMLGGMGQHGGEHCSGGMGWSATSVFFTAATTIDRASGALHRATIGHGLSVNGDAPSASGAGRQYVTQHIVIPGLDIGMAISGDGFSAGSALTLAREIVATATPTCPPTTG